MNAYTPQGHDPSAQPPPGQPPYTYHDRVADTYVVKGV